MRKFLHQLQCTADTSNEDKYIQYPEIAKALSEQGIIDTRLSYLCLTLSRLLVFAHFRYRPVTLLIIFITRFISNKLSQCMVFDSVTMPSVSTSVSFYVSGIELGLSLSKLDTNRNVHN